MPGMCSSVGLAVCMIQSCALHCVPPHDYQVEAGELKLRVRVLEAERAARRAGVMQVWTCCFRTDVVNATACPVCLPAHEHMHSCCLGLHWKHGFSITLFTILVLTAPLITWTDLLLAAPKAHIMTS